MMWGDALEPSAKRDALLFQIAFIDFKAGIHPCSRLRPILILRLVFPPCPMAARCARECVADRIFDVLETHGDLVTL